MEPFVNLPELTIQKLGKDLVATPPAMGNGSPDHEDKSCSDEASVEEYVGQVDSESDVEDDADSESEDGDEAKEQHEASAAEEGDNEDDEEVDDGTKAYLPERNLSAEEEKKSDDSPCLSKPIKRRKSSDAEKDAVKKKKRKKKKEVKKEQDTDSESDSGKKRKEKRTKNMRKNIREVMKEDELDEETKAAQRLEMERLKRFEEQQRKWMQMEREKQKAAMMQAFMRSPAVLNNCTITPMGLNSAAVDNQLPSFHSWTSQSEEPPYESAKSGQTDRKNHLPDVKASIDRLKSTSFGEVSITSCKPESATVAQKDPNSTKQKECVTISSSDDDCMIVAASDAEDEIDDPTNSGSHTNDLFNIPDEQGRVLVNILEHARGDPAVYLAPQIARVIKAHQIGGIRFLYDNVIESLERCRTSDGFGCILAHSMGLGKTLQVVSFCDIFLRHTEGRHVLCIMPINTLQNWLAEFNMWVPEEVPLNATEEIRPRNFKLHVLNDAQKTLAARAKVIRQWRLDGGVLLIGYELYRLLSLRRDKGSKKKKFTPLVELEDEDNRKKVLWSEIHTALIKPGPDLVICDEGHRIKNSHASISHALKSIQTKRRVVLTGYPLQNNLMEYWCMVDFVRPNYLGTKAEFSNMFERPIQNGQCVDSTAEDVKTMRYRAHVLHSLLNGFVQRRSHEVLQKALPQKNEYVLLFRMTPIQRLLYSAFMNEVVKTKAVANPLKAFSVCCKIWNHPDILFCFLKKRMEGDDLDLEDPVVANSTGPNAQAKTGKTNRSKKTAKPTTEDKIEVAPNQEPAPAVQNPDYQNFGYGESSNQFNQQLYHQDFYNNPQQHSFQQPQNQFQSSGDDSFNSFGMSQSFQPQQQLQGWQQQAGFTQNQNLYDGQYENPYAMLPTTLEQRPKNDAPMNALDRRGAESKEIQSIEKMLDEKLENQKDDEIKGLLETGSNMPKGGGRDDNTIPYDWATEILKGYKPGVIENSSKMLALFCILEESLKVGDRILLFSQSLFTLNLIEDFLHQNFVPETDEKWAKNVHYFRLDGSTAAIERERLINEFNANPRLSLFLVSTRAGSLGINLVGANRVIVFDASWNPCHDTQAVCRVYRYGQMKKCYVYRLVMDNCLEKKIYDRQINKQGMADRVVDELNPDAHLSLKEVSNLLCDSEEEAPLIDLSLDASKYSTDSVLHNMLKKYGTILTKSPFQHESLLVDRKDKKLSKAEKRLAQRHYDQEKQASSRPSFNNYYGGQQGSYSTSGGGIVHSAPATLPIRHDQHAVPSMRPSLPRPASTRGSRWVPPEAFRKYGMEVKEIRLEKDYTMEANTPDRVISLKAGQKALILRGPKGVFMQTEDGKIVALRSKHPQFGPPDAKSNVVKNLLPRHSQLTVTARPVAQPQRHATWANAMVPPDVLDLANSSSSSNSPGGMVVPGADDSFPLPATAQKKHLPPSYNEHQQQQQQQHLQFLQPSMRSSGGGIVGSNANEYSYQQNFNSYEQPQQQQQQSYGNNSYSAFHRPDFVPNEASNAGYASQYDYAGNMYHAEMYATPPAYLQENYTYQQQPGYNNSMFSSSSQSSGQHYSHPQS